MSFGPATAVCPQKPQALPQGHPRAFVFCVPGGTCVQFQDAGKPQPTGSRAGRWAVGTLGDNSTLVLLFWKCVDGSSWFSDGLKGSYPDFCGWLLEAEGNPPLYLSFGIHFYACVCLCFKTGFHSVVQAVPESTV